jgi:hypothetical protein
VAAVESDAVALGAAWDLKTGSAELMPLPQSTLTKIATNPTAQAVKTGQFHAFPKNSFVALTKTVFRISALSV